MTTKDQAITQALSEHMPEGATHIAIADSYQGSGPTIELRTYAFKYDDGVLKVFDSDNDGEYAHWTPAERRFKRVPDVVPIYAKPTPDCRTCEHIEGTYCANRIHRGIRCTNGDQYIEAPKVVLWRTE